MNARQERFVAEYQIDLNATQAAIRAGYSPRTASVQGYALLRNPQLASLLAQLQRETLEKAAGSAEWIVQQAVETVREARAAGQLSVVASNLALLAKRHPEFSEKHDISANVRMQALSAVAMMSETQLLALANLDVDAPSLLTGPQEAP